MQVNMWQTDDLNKLTSNSGLLTKPPQEGSKLVGGTNPGRPVPAGLGKDGKPRMMSSKGNINLCENQVSEADKLRTFWHEYWHAMGADVMVGALNHGIPREDAAAFVDYWFGNSEHGHSVAEGFAEWIVWLGVGDELFSSVTSPSNLGGIVGPKPYL